MSQNKQLDQLLDALFGPSAGQHLEALSRPKRPGLRLNLLKASEDAIFSLLQDQGYRLSPLGFCPGAYRIDYYPKEIGRTPEHLLGLIYIQDPASMLPAVVLDPKPGQLVLDLSAAPGSKTTQMCTMMANTGLILANDPDRARLKALNGNLDRWGCLNTATASIDGGKLGRVYPEYFHRVLVDAPCSGLGTLHKNPDILKWWSFDKVTGFVRVQKRLVVSAYDALARGGRMVYSTCTITPQENEGVIAFLLEQRPGARLIEFDIPAIKAQPGLVQGPGLESNAQAIQLSKTARIYPWDNPDTEAFFMALIEKPEEPDPQER